MRRLHMWPGEGFLAVPVLDEQEAVWVLRINMDMDPMKRCLIGDYGLDDVSEFLAGEIGLSGLDVANDDDCDQVHLRALQE